MRKKRIKKQTCSGIMETAGMSSCCGGEGGGPFAAAAAFRAGQSPSSCCACFPSKIEKGEEKENGEEEEENGDGEEDIWFGGACLLVCLLTYLCIYADEVRNIELKIVEEEKRKEQRHGSEKDELRVHAFAGLLLQGVVDDNDNEEEVDEDNECHEFVDDVEKGSVVVLQHGLDVCIFDILGIPEFVDFGEDLFPAVDGGIVAVGRHIMWLYVCVYVFVFGFVFLQSGEIIIKIIPFPLPARA